ncbi:angiopoietin-related protein 1-like [Teleopsis dalmanni]|uniref:angiopoietin-related protein 1-like n=1 Tax=Teleopsis dalmanni TaxID=139649 RepID=UPI0018CDBE1C|nr:angiopoietin-related protein 1-like [Teleopsis dalmanni]XP_037940725.1 angiopoietin-related protein 1-like [Teleopsis dalmanni]
MKIYLLELFFLVCFVRYAKPESVTVATTEYLDRKFRELQNFLDDKNRVDTKVQKPGYLVETVDSLYFPYPKSLPKTCAEATQITKSSGVYEIQLPNLKTPLLVYCDEFEGVNDWLTIHRRIDDSINFFRDWETYKEGFGNIFTNYFIGLDNLYALTSNQIQELLIVMVDIYDISYIARYDSFGIGNEVDKYRLNLLGSFRGNVTDQFSYHINQKFSTYDEDNDLYPTHCALYHETAGWANNCFQNDFNCPYEEIVWPGLPPLQKVKMLIRPVNNSPIRLDNY